MSSVQRPPTQNVAPLLTPVSPPAFGVQRPTVALCAFAFAAGAMGQEVLAPPTPPPMDFSIVAPAVRGPGAAQTGGPSGGNFASGNEPLLRWGQINFRPHFNYRLSYGSGVQARPGQGLAVVINELSPGALFQIGQHWTLDYTPTLRYYSNRNFRDTTDHAVNLSGATTYEDWTLGFSQSYASSSQPLVETGTQTDTESYSTGLNAGYSINSQTSLELGLNQNFRFVGQNQAGFALQDSREWSTMDWLNYQLWPRLGAAVGFGFGYVDLSASSDMTYEQLQGRITWKPTDKLSFILNGGLDDRQFLDSNASPLLNPIFGLTAAYMPFEVTTLSLTASRSVSASYFQSQVTEGTMVSANLQQRLLKRLNLSLGGGYRLSSYQATTTGLDVNREDSGTFFSASLGMNFLKRANVSVFYYTSDDSSSEAGFTYSTWQVGLQLGYHF